MFYQLFLNLFPIYKYLTIIFFYKCRFVRISFISNIFISTICSYFNCFEYFHIRNMLYSKYFQIHEQNDEVTPRQLMQTYIFCEAQDKFDVFFSFVKTHLKCKCIVFLSSCKQVCVIVPFKF